MVSPTRKAEDVFREAGALLLQWLLPAATCSVACTCSVAGEIAVVADWESWCTHEFGAACKQYLAYLGLISGQASRLHWRQLYLRLRRLHVKLRNPSELRSLRENTKPWRSRHPSMMATVLSGANDSVQLLQGGHTVLFSGCSDAIHVARLADSSERATLHIESFLDVAPVAPWQFIAVTHALALERWCLNPGMPAECVCQRSLPLQVEVEDGLRLFIEHVANRLFVFNGEEIVAFELESLDLQYSITYEGGRNEELDAVALLARWDYGRTFLLYQQEATLVSVWSTLSGDPLGCIHTSLGLLCCDLTHLSSSSSSRSSSSSNIREQVPEPLILATLQVDGNIRLYRKDGTSDEWVTLKVIVSWSDHQPFTIVEVKLEGSLLVAVSSDRCNGGWAPRWSQGAVHVWDIGDGKADGHRMRYFSATPDFVEVRHGGAFIEVCLPPTRPGHWPPVRWPSGIVEQYWLDPRGLLPTLLHCPHASLGDWRCDVRDGVALVEAGSNSLRWFPFWVWSSLDPAVDRVPSNRLATNRLPFKRLRTKTSLDTIARGWARRLME